MSEKLRLGDVLVSLGATSRDQLELALSSLAGKGRLRTGERLLNAGLVTEGQLASAISQQLELPILSPSPTLLSNALDLASILPRRIAERHVLIPVSFSDREIVLAMADPTDIVAIDDVRMLVGRRQIVRGVASPSLIRQAISTLYNFEETSTEIVDELVPDRYVEFIPFEAKEEEENGTQALSDAPIVRLVNTLFSEAVRLRATDIHLDPRRSNALIRYRIDGLLRDAMPLPKHLQLPFTSRVKLISGMDISESRRPQDGRGRIHVDSREVDTRISTIPTMFGERIVIRLLPKDEGVLGLDQLGMEEDQLTLFRSALEHSQGLLILTGPTGSGKTTTLYSAMKQIASPEKSIVSLEDPIEYQIGGVNQVQVDERIGITFARGLRSLLRQDPDVIMVGEIRDAETAEIAVQAALTGHLVLTTLHTNDAASAVTRLLDIGVEASMIAPALSMVVAQRLLRLTCRDCLGAGCDQCGSSGYRGRTGVFEMIPMTRDLVDVATTNFSESALRRAARLEGHKGLRDHAFKKVERGVTTQAEALRITQVQRDSSSRCPACDTEIDPEFVVCPMCGTDLSGAQCQSCGRRSHSEWSVCPYCRSSLEMINESSALKLVDSGDFKIR